MPASSDRQLLLGLRPEGVPTFDNFVAGSNGELLQRLRALRGGEQVYLWGEAGSGRSHLLAAIATSLRNAGREAVALSASEVDEEPTPAHGTTLLVDDVDRISAAGQAALFRIFIAARERGWGMVLAGAVPPVQLALREDLRTRIGQMLIYEIKALSDDEKAAALHHYADQRGLPLDATVVRYLLQHGRRDLPSLLTMLDRLDEISLARQRPPTLPLLRELMTTIKQTENE